MKHVIPTIILLSFASQASADDFTKCAEWLNAQTFVQEIGTKPEGRALVSLEENYITEGTDIPGYVPRLPRLRFTANGLELTSSYPPPTGNLVSGVEYNFSHPNIIQTYCDDDVDVTTLEECESLVKRPAETIKENIKVLREDASNPQRITGIKIQTGGLHFWDQTYSKIVKSDYSVSFDYSGPGNVCKPRIVKSGDVKIRDLAVCESHAIKPLPEKFGIPEGFTAQEIKDRIGAIDPVNSELKALIFNDLDALVKSNSGGEQMSTENAERSWTFFYRNTYLKQCRGFQGFEGSDGEQSVAARSNGMNDWNLSSFASPVTPATPAAPTSPSATTR
jgi:hypothetical protein